MSLGSSSRPIWPDIFCKFHPLRGLFNRGRGIYKRINSYPKRQRRMNTCPKTPTVRLVTKRPSRWVNKLRLIGRIDEKNFLIWNSVSAMRWDERVRKCLRMAKTKAQRQSMMKAVQQTATSTTSILILISANKGLQGATRGYKGLQGATIWNKGHKAIRSTGSTLHWMVGPVDKHCQTRMEDEQSKRLLCPFERK